MVVLLSINLVTKQKLKLMPKGRFSHLSEEEYKELRTQMAETKQRNNQAIKNHEKEIEFNDKIQEKNGFIFDNMINKIDKALDILNKL